MSATDWDSAMEWWKSYDNGSDSLNIATMIRNVANQELINDGFESIGSSDTNHMVYSIYRSWLLYVDYCKKNNLTENIFSFLLDYTA